VIAGVATVVVTAVLTTAPPGRAAAGAQAQPTATLRTAAAQPGVVVALAAIVLGGLVGGMISLLAPLELHAAGFSEASIGLAFSGAAVIFIAASALTVRLGERAMNVSVILLGGVAFALALTPATLSGAAGAVVAVLCVSAPLRALLFTASYPLAAASGGGVGAGTAIGLLNGAWAVTSMLGPLGGGALAETVGPRVTYGILQALGLATVAAAWAGARRHGALRRRPALVRRR